MDNEQSDTRNNEYSVDFLSPFTPSPIRSGSSFFPNATSVLPNNTKLNPNPPSTSSPSVGDLQKEKTLRRMTSDDAMNLAILLSEQDSMYGVNMYDSLAPQDEATIQTLLREGMTLEQAVLKIFNTKHPPKSNPASSSVPSASPASLAVDQVGCFYFLTHL